MQEFSAELQLAGHQYPVLNAKGIEGLSIPFRFEVTVLSVSHYQDIDKLLLLPALLTLANAVQGQRCIAGVITQARCQECQRQQAARITLVIEPRMALLKLHSEPRIFCGKTDLEIVPFLLKQHGYHPAQLQFHLLQKCIAKDYRLQVPGESDFDYISRILANAGIYYWFDTIEGCEQVHFADCNDTGQSKIQLAYKPLQGDSQQDAYLSHLKLQYRLMPGQVIVRDFYEENPNLDINSSYGEIDRCVHDYFGLGTYTHDNAAQKAKLIHQQQIALAMCVQGNSQAINLKPGRRVCLEINEFSPINNQDYLVIKVQHFVNYSSKLQKCSYHNKILLIPFAVPYRPTLKRLPNKPLLFNGKISASKETDVLDQQGRYFLQFLFKTTQYGTMPAWRYIMPFGGLPTHQQRVGWHMPLANGTEVLLNHFNSDPDRPCILGACYDAAHPDPVTAKNNKHHLLKTAAGHALLFDETDGCQQIKISTPFDYNAVVLNAKQDEPNIDITSLAGNLVLSANAQLSIHADGYIQEDCFNQREDHADQGVLVIAKQGEIHYQATHDLTYEAEEMKITARESINLAAEKQINIECQQMQVQAKNIVLDGEKLCVIAEKKCLLEVDQLLQCGNKGTGITIAADGTIHCYGHVINFSGDVGYYGLLLDEMAGKPMPAVKVKKVPEPLTVGELFAQQGDLSLQEDILHCAIDHDIEQTLPIYRTIREKTPYLFHTKQGQAINQGIVKNTALQPLVISLQQSVILKG